MDIDVSRVERVELFGIVKHSAEIWTRKISIVESGECEDIVHEITMTGSTEDGLKVVISGCKLV